MNKPTKISFDNSKRVEVEKGYTVDNFLSKEEDIGYSMVRTHLDGKHPFMKNINSNRTYYLLGGSAKFVFEEETIDIQSGEMLSIPKNTKYAFEGKFDAILVDCPAFNQEDDTIYSEELVGEYKKKNRILITGSILNSNPSSINIYEKIIGFIDRDKYEVYSPLDTMKFVGSDEEKYNRAMDLLKDTKLMIAEMSSISTGQGMELQEAVRLETPVLVIAKNGSKISSLVKGCKNIKSIIYYENIENIKNDILDFIDK